MMYPLIKRSLDLFLSAIALLLLSPIMLVLSALIKLGSTGPVLYKGIRAGKEGKPFKMVKFRTMVVNADKVGGPSTSDDDPRVTPIGKMMRRYKLDELPQLVNVLMGEMSFVGPRPEVLSEVEKYSPEERRLLSIRPGITDWASIEYNNEGEILKGAADPHQAYLEKIRPGKVRLGLEYVERRSILVDFQILFATFTTIFKTRVS